VRSPPLRLSLSTAGGDAPGLNAALRAVVLAADRLGWEVWGIERGYDGLLTGRGIRRLRPSSVRGLLPQGGTILGATTSGDPFRYPVREGGRIRERDLSDRLLRLFRRLRIDAHIAIGGNGTLSIAEKLFRKGLRVVGLPKTIDNDLPGTPITCGFDTAVSVAVEALDRLRTTAASHGRVHVAEVMGRDTGWIALHAGIAGGADAILIPEIPYRLEALARAVRERCRGAGGHALIVAAEGAHPRGEGPILRDSGGPGGRPPRLGGIAERLAADLEGRTGRPCRSVALGHLQRGGTPTPFDRALATRLGTAAVRLVQEGRFGCMAAVTAAGAIAAVPLSRVADRLKRVPPDGEPVRAARAMGISFGDE